MLADNSYGKDAVRLVKVVRRGDRHELRDLTLSIRFEGDFGAAHVEGDNTAVLPTDAMRGTAYAFAGDAELESIEAFAGRLAAHFLAAAPAARRVTVEVVEDRWDSLDATAFSRGEGDRRTATVEASADGLTVRAGIADLLLCKTAGSAFAGFLRDEYTTLAETKDRILATSMTAEWRYAYGEVDYDASAAAVREALLEAFAAHDSASVQHTLYAMGSAVLASRDEVAEVHLHMPNRHHNLVDLSPYGLDNPGEVFVATAEPFGVIEGTVRRGADQHSG